VRERGETGLYRTHWNGMERRCFVNRRLGIRPPRRHAQVVLGGESRVYFDERR
jgi:hypothetical protein